MSSVFNTASAQVALGALQRVNAAFGASNNHISTGRTINTAADNPAIWALAQQTDQAAADYATIGQSLTLAKATVATSRTGAENVVGALGQIKSKIIQASAPGADAEALQTDINALKEQISGAVSGAGFNGANLLQDASPSGASTFSFIAGRQNGQTTSIEVDAQNLRPAAPVFGGDAVAAADIGDYVSADAATVGAASVESLDIEAGGVAAGVSYRITLEGDGAHALGAGTSFEYVARAGDTSADVARALGDQIQSYIADNNLGASVNVTVDPANGRLNIGNSDAADAIEVSVEVARGGDAGGKLAALDAIDVTTESGRASALGAIEGLISSATNAAATLGAVEKRIDASSAFVDQLADVKRTALSGLVDANMEREASELRALKIQQQLAVVSLSISNQSQARLLELFK